MSSNFIIWWQGSRKHLKVDGLNVYPATPVGYFAGQHPAFGEAKANLYGFVWQHQKLPQLDSYPVTPIGYFAGQHPAFGETHANRSALVVTRQTLPQLDQYTATPVGYFAGQHPAFGKTSAFGSEFVWRLQSLPPHPDNVRIAATLGAYLEKQVILRRDIDRRLQYVPQLDEWTAVSAVSAATLGSHFKQNVIPRHDIDRRLQFVPELNQYTATPAAPASTSLAGLAIPFTIYDIRSRRHQWWMPLPHTPATPEVIAQSGYHPGSIRVTANRTSFDRIQLNAPDPIGAFSEVAAPAAEPFTAWVIATPAAKWPEVAQYLQLTGLGVYKITDQNYYSGWALAFERAQQANRVSFKRHLQVVAHPVDTPATAVTEAIIPAYFAPKQHVNWNDQRKIVQFPRLDVYPRTIQSPAAYAPVQTIKRRETARIIQFPLQLDERPQTPAVAAQPPTAFLAPTTFRRHGRFNLVDVPRFPDRQIAVFPSDIRDAVNHVWYWDRYKRA